MIANRWTVTTAHVLTKSMVISAIATADMLEHIAKQVGKITRLQAILLNTNLSLSLQISLILSVSLFTNRRFFLSVNVDLIFFSNNQ